MRPISSGIQTYQTDPTEYPVSAPVGKPEAIEQAAGEVQYLDDRPLQEGTLFGAFMISNCCNCTLASIDTSKVAAALGEHDCVCVCVCVCVFVFELVCLYWFVCIQFISNFESLF